MRIRSQKVWNMSLGHCELKDSFSRFTKDIIGPIMRHRMLSKKKKKKKGQQKKWDLAF